MRIGGGALAGTMAQQRAQRKVSEGGRNLPALLTTVARLQAEFASQIHPRDSHLWERSFLRAMVDQAPDNLFVKDLQSRFVVLNRAISNMHGHDDPEAMIGLSDFDLHPRELAQQFFDIEQDIMRSGKPIIDMTELVVDADGRKR